MSAPQQTAYRLLGRNGVFLHRREAVSALIQRGGLGKTQIAGEDERQYRVTDFQGATHRVLFVCGFHVNFVGNYAIFREAVEATVGTPAAEVRYVVLVNTGDDWAVRAVVAGPLGDSNSNVEVGISQAMMGGDLNTTASALVRIPTAYLHVAAVMALQRVAMRRVLDEAAAVGTGFQQPDCKNIGAHLELHRDSLGNDDAALGTVSIGTTRVNAFYISHEVKADPGDPKRTLRVAICLYVTDSDSPHETRYVTVLRWDIPSNTWRLPHENGALMERGNLIPALQLGSDQAIPALQSIATDLRQG